MSEAEATKTESSSADPIAWIRKVGRGKTLSRDLSGDEAISAFDLLLRGGFTPAQAGAFLQALRIKELSQDELNGMLEAVYRWMKPVPSMPGVGFTLNVASDTPRKGGLACLVAAQLLAGRGLNVGVVRSDPMLSGNEASFDESFRVPSGLIPDSLSRAGSMRVFSVYDLIPDLEKLRSLRRELGFRSCLHTAEKMVNPWPKQPVILGISHRHYAERMAETLRHRGMTGKIVLGNHGTPDLALHKETEVWEVLDSGEVRVIHVHPAAMGLEPDPAAYTLGFFPEWSRELQKSGQGILGPVLKYHETFLRYAAGETELLSSLVSTQMDTQKESHGAA